MSIQSRHAYQASGNDKLISLKSLFIAMAGLVLARLVNPVTTQQMIGIIMGMGI
jgi:hypothetical protein